MGRAMLTALAVERAHRSGQPLLLSDGDGLYLRKQTRDGASWTLRYRFADREHWITLGHYPDMSLAEARMEARLARVLLDKIATPSSCCSRSASARASCLAPGGQSLISTEARLWVRCGTFRARARRPA
jgi:hypothetical protein